MERDFRMSTNPTELVGPHGLGVSPDGRYYYGADCMHVLALLGSESTIFNRLNRWIFSRRRLARVLYPILVGCRKLTLRILGRPPIVNL